MPGFGLPCLVNSYVKSFGLMSSLRDKKKDEEDSAKKSGMMTPNMKAAQDVKRMAAGGRARKRPIDGIATKGKTRAIY